MLPNDPVSLVPTRVLEQRFSEIEYGGRNRHIREWLFKPLMDWARTKPPSFPAWELIEAIAERIATYATSLPDAGQQSFGFLLPSLLPQIVNAMIDGADERRAILGGIHAVFVPEPPPPAA